MEMKTEHNNLSEFQSAEKINKRSVSTRRLWNQKKSVDEQRTIAAPRLESHDYDHY